MSVNPVGGGAPAQTHIQAPAPAAAATKPEALEIPGAPDPDHQSDKGSHRAMTQVATPAKITPGQVNLKA